MRSAPQRTQGWKALPELEQAQFLGELVPGAGTDESAKKGEDGEKQRKRRHDVLTENEDSADEQQDLFKEGNYPY